MPVDSRFTSETQETINFGFWLCFSRDGSMRMTRMDPRLGRGERAMYVTATLPKAVFSPPALHATITLSAPEAADFKIDTEAAAKALRGVVGVDIDLVVHPQASGVDDALAARRLADQP